MEQFIQQYWGQLLAGISFIGWLARLEYSSQRTQSEMSTYYATKTEVSELKGAIGAIAVQLPDMKTSLTRIESKIDTYVIAGSRAPHA